MFSLNRFLIAIKLLGTLSSLMIAHSQAIAETRLKLRGGVHGGGGKAVVCPSSVGKPSVRLLDLWEAETLFNHTPVQLADTLEASVEKAFLNLENSYLMYTKMGRGSKTCENQDCLMLILKETAQRFLHPDEKVKRLRGVDLNKTEDSFELARPKGCDFLQVINYQPDDTILIDQDLFEQMSLIDQTALIVHESYYRFLREFPSHEANSIRTRRAVGYVMSDKSFELDPFPQPQKYLYCSFNGVPFAPTSLYIYPSSLPEYSSAVSVFIHDINGSRLIGAKQPFMSFSLGNQTNKDLFTGTCNSEMQTIVEFFGNGVVEFDHAFQMNFDCKDQKMSIYLTNTKAGEAPKTNKLDCKTIDKSIEVAK